MLPYLIIGLFISLPVLAIIGLVAIIRRSELFKEESHENRPSENI